MEIVQFHRIKITKHCPVDEVANHADQRCAFPRLQVREDGVDLGPGQPLLDKMQLVVHLVLVRLLPIVMNYLLLHLPLLAPVDLVQGSLVLDYV